MAKQNAQSVEMGGSPQTSASTHEYFTPAIQEMINKMQIDEMERELTNLESSRGWIAMLKYNQSRLRQAQTAVLTGDPVKDPTGISRNQGIMIGVCDLQNAVIILKQDRDEKEAGTNVE